MVVKVAINGFGRIGRNVLRAIIESGRDDISVIAINDLGPVETNAHLMRFDSVHGRFPGTVRVDGDTMDVGTGPIAVTAIRDPKELPWDGVDVALECTGFFADREMAGYHLENGSKRVLISAPAGGADKTIVYGVNHHTLTADDLVVSNASCTTNCLAPLAKVLHEGIGIEHGLMTTIHAYTNDQVLTDVFHPDLRRARSATMSQIPTKTGAAAAVGLVLPELAGKLDGFSMRVPTINVSVVDLTFVASRATSIEEVNAVVKAAAEGSMSGVMQYNELPLVSVDFNHNPHSSIFDAGLTRVMEGTLVKVLSWYDNEWGFSNRMLDTTLALINA